MRKPTGAASHDTKKKEEPMSTSESSKIVIGVDDAPENLFLLQATVKAAGYPFMGVKGGAECITLLARVQPRLVLLDIEMPGMDGFETCKRIRQMREYQHVPICFLTARKTDEDVKRGVEVGGNDFIIKPFNPAQLLERIKYWCARQAPARP
jgi:DNA-binding response OmpR family regulator